ncbi:MAG: hypothetical protein HY822_16235 [Acidobacteria bacterium]|nr:hypothetical protein [Acidobacteriota bacterium]
MKLIAHMLAAAGLAAAGQNVAGRRADVESFEKVWATVRDRHYDPLLGGLDWEAESATSSSAVSSTPST